ncbi:hypothetical protein RFI_27290 [Reticulomyxa filosa]|uniref:Uncharacterized protein n=1 Tax=Reticulomyxa filosa TaxID=46433 RepID=X6M8U7_RETFI|nr:hypothetical protein RFI_27290 [Reticulomyxa filosa]|eukprot:ETO10086.1 hypothetical protein RFI_27290 [Reticulomyxa filosa]
MELQKLIETNKHVNKKNVNQKRIQQLENLVNEQKLEIGQLNAKVATQETMLRQKSTALTKTRSELSEIEHRFEEYKMKGKENVDIGSPIQVLHSLNFPKKKKDDNDYPTYEYTPFFIFKINLPKKLMDACTIYFDAVKMVQNWIVKYDTLSQQSIKMLRQQKKNKKNKKNRAIRKKKKFTSKFKINAQL